MIKDASGNELTYWPISGLVEGGNSQTLNFTVEVPNRGSHLKSTHDSRIKVWAKKVGDIAFVDISSGSGYNLAGLENTDADFQVYIEALTPISGLERIPVNIVAAVAYSAGWLD